jgi:hypothetical protein
MATVAEHESVVAAAVAHHAQAGGRVLLVVRLRPAYSTSAHGFPPLGGLPVSDDQCQVQLERFAVIYAEAARSLLGAGVEAVRAALVAAANGITLDPPAAGPLALGGGLVSSVEVGIVTKELLRPSPRYAFLLQGDAGTIVMSTPEGDALRALATSSELGLMSSRAFALKLAGSAGGLIRKLTGLALPRKERKKGNGGGRASRKAAAGAASEPSAARLLEALPATDVVGHLQLASSWLQFAASMPLPSATHADQSAQISQEQDNADGDRAIQLQGGSALQSLLEETLAVLSAVAAAGDPTAAPNNPPTMAPLLQRWQRAAEAAMPPASTASKEGDVASAERVRVAVAAWLCAVRETDLITFARIGGGGGGGSGGGGLVYDKPEVPVGCVVSHVSAKLRSLLWALDPRGQLPVRKRQCFPSNCVSFRLSRACLGKSSLFMPKQLNRLFLSTGGTRGLRPPVRLLNVQSGDSCFRRGLSSGCVICGKPQNKTVLRRHCIFK